MHPAAMRLHRAHASLVLERPTLEAPGEHQVLLEVQACGIAHLLTKLSTRCAPESFTEI